MRRLALCAVTLCACGGSPADNAAAFLPGLVTARTFSVPKDNGARTDVSYAVGVLSAASNGSTLYIIESTTLSGVSDNSSDPEDPPNLGFASFQYVSGSLSLDGGKTFTDADAPAIPGSTAMGDPVAAYFPRIVKVLANGAVMFIASANIPVYCSGFDCTMGGAAARVGVLLSPNQNPTGKYYLSSYGMRPFSASAGAAFSSKDGFALLDAGPGSAVGSTEDVLDAFVATNGMLTETSTRNYFPNEPCVAAGINGTPESLDFTTSGHCGIGGEPVNCAYAYHVGDPLPPKKVCAPDGELFSEAQTAPNFSTRGVPWLIYKHGDMNYAATITPAGSHAIAIGGGRFLGNDIYGGLVELVGDDGTHRFIQPDLTAPTEVALRMRACASGDSCDSELQFAISLANDEWIELYRDNTPTDSTNIYNIDVLRETIHPTPLAVTDPNMMGVGPVGGCPGASEASPIVAACLRFAACYPSPAPAEGFTNDTMAVLRRCVLDWSVPMPSAIEQAFVATTTCEGFLATYPASQSIPAYLPGVPKPACYYSCSVVPAQRCPTVDCSTPPDPCASSGGVAGCVGDLACNAGNHVGLPPAADCTLLGEHCALASTSTPSAQCAAPVACKVNPQCMGNLAVFPLDGGAVYADCTKMGFSKCTFLTMGSGSVSETWGPVCAN